MYVSLCCSRLEAGWSLRWGPYFIRYRMGTLFMGGLEICVGEALLYNVKGLGFEMGALLLKLWGS